MPQDALVTPPIRQSVEDTKSAQANGIAQPMTEKSWYFFWDRLGKMANRQNWMVNVGTHADRPPAGNMPEGAIYVEYDRGAIYQNWTGAWQYLAGTMWGTMTPDQRPTDLGSHDAGFDFRSTDTPPREFIWSGAAWVETTAVTGAVNLTHPNVVTKVGSTIGQIVEGGITDLSAGNSNTVNITAAGLVGIGTTNPATKLHVYRANAGAVTAITVDNDGGGTGVGQAVRFAYGGTGFLGGIYHQLDASGWNIRLKAWNNSTEVERVTINGYTGNVGIGTTSPQAGLDVNGTARIIGSSASPASGVGIELAYGSGTGVMYCYDRGASAWQQLSIAGSKLFLNAAGSSPGYVGIGTTNPTHQLELSTDSGAKPGTSTWTVVSDSRLKQNIEAVKDDSLAILGRLNWIRYEYNGQANTPRGLKAIGLGAQELCNYLPEAVRSAKNKLNETDEAETDLLAIDYHHILVHSARAIQQLDAEVKRLRTLVEKPQTG